MLDDLIKRKDILKPFVINERGERIPEKDCDNLDIQVPLRTIKKIIKEVPSVNHEGKWIKSLSEYYDFACSECRSRASRHPFGYNVIWLSKHCPECGAKMVGYDKEWAEIVKNVRIDC